MRTTKIGQLLEALELSCGSIWEDGKMFKNPVHETLYNLSHCASMIESHLTYNYYERGEDFMDSKYSKEYVKELGYDTVKALWDKMRKYFDKYCSVDENV